MTPKRKQHFLKYLRKKVKDNLEISKKELILYNKLLLLKT